MSPIVISGKSIILQSLQTLSIMIQGIWNLPPLTQV